MTSTNAVEAAASKKASKPKPAESEKRELIEQAIQKRERLAESQLAMARLFLQSDKREIALRRLKEVVAGTGGPVPATAVNGRMPWKC